MLRQYIVLIYGNFYQLQFCKTIFAERKYISPREMKRKAMANN